MSSTPAQTGRERRKHTRYRINLKSSVEIDGRATPVMDISWGGICLYDREDHEVGENLNFFTGGLIVSAHVLDCSPLESIPEGADYAYRIRCQFAEAPEHPDIQALMKVVWSEEFNED